MVTACCVEVRVLPGRHPEEQSDEGSPSTKPTVHDHGLYLPTKSAVARQSSGIRYQWGLFERKVLGIGPRELGCGPPIDIKLLATTGPVTPTGVEAPPDTKIILDCVKPPLGKALS